MAYELMFFMAGLAIPSGWKVVPMASCLPAYSGFVHDGLVCLMRVAA